MSVENNNDNITNHENEAVTAVLKTRSELAQVISALQDRGFRKSDVSVLMPTIKGRHEMTFENETKAYKGGVYGGLAGLVVGSIYGWMAANRYLTIPGTEFLLGRAPWLLIAAGIGYGVLIGGLLGVVIGMGFPEYVARLYERSIKGGNMLISIHVDNRTWKQRAIDILKFHGAQHISAKRKERLHS